MIKKILQCPECSNRFRVPADAIGAAGRKVRCASCKHVWYAQRQDLLTEDEHSDSALDDIDNTVNMNELNQEDESDNSLINNDHTVLEEDSLKTSDNVEDVAPKIDTLFPDMRQSRTDIKEKQVQKRFAAQRRMLYIANAICLVSVLFLAAIIYRNTIIAKFPYAAPFYAAIGYHKSDNIILGDVTLLHNSVGTKDRFKIKSLIINQSGEDAPLPTARVRLISAEGTILQEGYDTKDNVLRANDNKDYDVEFEASNALNADTLSIEIGSPIELYLRK